jgi:hypothetical protein
MYGRKKMITVKMLAHKNQDVYSISSREEGRRFFQDISKDGTIVDPISVEKGFLIDSKSEDGEDDIVKVSMIMSDPYTDRDYERFKMDGWELNEFMRNPVLLWSHDRSRPAIGYMENVQGGKELSGVAVFSDKTIDHFGWSIGQKLRKGILRAGSVGALPLEWQFIDDPNDDAWLEFTKQTLVEFSICNVPANPRALVQDAVSPYKQLEAIENELKELTNLLKKEDNATIERKTIYDILGRAASTVQRLNA